MCPLYGRRQVPRIAPIKLFSFFLLFFGGCNDVIRVNAPLQGENK